MIEKYFNLKLNSGRIKRYLKTIVPETTVYKGELINVSAVQRNIKLVKKVEDFIDSLHSYVREASSRGSRLVAFPEYNFLDLFGIVPGFKSIDIFQNEDVVDYYTLFYSISETIKEAVEAIMCSLAEKYNIYIYTGSYFIKENKKLYNAGSIISPQGKILGTQKKLYLTPLEKSFGLTEGKSIEVMDTDLGRVSCPMCIDGMHIETFRLLQDIGCDIAIIPNANFDEKNSSIIPLRGALLRAQESYMYIIKPAITGNFFGIHFTGRSGIYAPIDITPGKNGILKVSRDYSGSSLITTELNLDLLHNSRINAEYFGDRNYEFEKVYNETMQRISSGI